MTSSVPTQSRSVLTFDGQNDYIDFGKNDIGGVFAQGSSAFTISGWVNPHQLTNKASTYGTHNVFFARSSDRYSDNFEFGINESGNLDVYIDEKIDNVIKTFGSGELTVGQWHFLAIVFNAGQLTIYLNEHEYTGSLAGTSLNNATSSVTLGATLHNYIYFTGQLANISVWNYPCTGAEIQRNRSGALVGNELGLVAYWKLDEGLGTTIRDYTGNTHDGTLHGNPTWDLAELPFGIAQSSNENLPIQSKIVLVSNERQTKRKKGTTKYTEELEKMIESADSIQTGISSQLEAQKSETAQTAQSGVLVNIEQPEQAQTFAEEELEKIIESADSYQVEAAQTGQSEVLVTIQQPEQAQVFAQEEPEKTMTPEGNPKYKILAIDGGGIRGIIPAMILAEIEKRTLKPISSLFDLIAGTSTGGILALGLTKPGLIDAFDGSPLPEYSAENLLQIYLEYGVEIFYEPFFERILGPIEDIFVQPKYSSEGREEILRQYFGSAPLEKNLKEVFVTSYDIEQRIPIFFTNKLEKQQTESKKFRKLCGGFTLTDAALATSATPTYFAPHRVSTFHNPNGFYTLVDGGVIANNPANLAIIEAQISRQEQKQVLNTEDILVVSLGTGSLTSVYPYDEVKKWGLLQWARPLLNIVFDGGSEVVAGELERLFESSVQDSKSSYYRFQTFLTNEQEEIDNPQLENIRSLQVVANRLIAERSQQIDELCSLLLKEI